MHGGNSKIIRNDKYTDWMNLEPYILPGGFLFTLHVPIWKWLAYDINWNWIPIESLWGGESLGTSRWAHAWAHGLWTWI